MERNTDIIHQKKKDNSFNKENWMKSGLIWAAFMFLIMTFAFPIFDGEAITMQSVLVNAILWPLAGLGFGYSLYFFLHKRKQ